jgi:hypothetical protein
MQSAVEMDGFGFAGDWAVRLASRIRALLRLLRSLSRQPTSESLEATIGRAVERAFAEFARELGG